MSLKDEFVKMIRQLGANYAIPPIAKVFLPPFYKGGQTKQTQFIAIILEGGATGVSYIMMPDEKMEAYNALHSKDFSGIDPLDFALDFGNEDPVKEMLGMASINAICQYVMKKTDFPIDTATDSLGLLSIERGDRIGMVGLFFELTPRISNAGAELIIVEKKEALLQKFRNLPITSDVKKLAGCNKVICTSTTVLNNTLDEILENCSTDTFVSVVGPSAGYFPDPLFALGVDVVGGRVVENSEEFLRRLEQGKRWGDTTLKTCFQKETYKSLIS